jgi:general secretion pathway protein G
VIGELIKLRGKGESGKGKGRDAFTSYPLPLTPRSCRGFTLLELMIVISILVILALIAMAQYNKTVQAAKEATLREDLYTMRKMIDQYAADKGKLPASLDDLQSAGYIHDIPIDPMTDQKDWQPDMGDDPGSTEGAQGLVNVHSASGDLASDGSTRYSDW